MLRVVSLTYLSLFSSLTVATALRQVRVTFRNCTPEYFTDTTTKPNSQEESHNRGTTGKFKKRDRSDRIGQQP